MDVRVFPGGPVLRILKNRGLEPAAVVLNPRRSKPLLAWLPVSSRLAQMCLSSTSLVSRKPRERDFAPLSPLRLQWVFLCWLA